MVEVLSRERENWKEKTTKNTGAAANKFNSKMQLLQRTGTQAG